MSVRLAFSVAIQVDADVLLVDEVLAVGDAAFQQKCFEQFHRLKDEGKTIVFVTHDMSAVERFCDRAMLLERGKIVVDRRAARDRARLQRAQLRPARARRRRGRPRYGDHAGGRDQGRVVRERAPASASPRSRRASRCALCMEVALPRGDRRPDVRASPAQRGRPHDLRDLDRPAATSRPGASRPATSSIVRVGARELARAGPLRADAVGRARAAAAPTCSTCARTSPSLIVHGTRQLGRHRRDPAHASSMERS